MARVYIEMDENDVILYKELNAKPEIVLTWIHREIVKILKETKDIYGAIKDMDEEMIVKGLIETAIRKKEKRLENYEVNKKRAEERIKKTEKMENQR